MGEGVGVGRSAPKPLATVFMRRPLDEAAEGELAAISREKLARSKKEKLPRNILFEIANLF